MPAEFAALRGCGRNKASLGLARQRYARDLLKVGQEADILPRTEKIRDCDVLALSNFECEQAIAFQRSVSLGDQPAVYVDPVARRE
jgi:hypothetical protein